MKRILCLIFCVLFIIMNNVCLYAEEDSILTIDVTEQKSQELISAFKIELKEEEEKNSPINCFDVSDNGMVALGLSNKVINIYNFDGKYLCSYTFEDYGDYRLKWIENKLIIYFQRSFVAAEITVGEKNVYMKEFISDWSLTDPEIAYLYETSRKYNNMQYVISKNNGFLSIFAPSYSKLEINNIDTGKVTRVYDISRIYTVRIVLWLTIVLFMIILIVVNIRKTVKKEAVKLKKQLKNV